MKQVILDGGVIAGRTQLHDALTVQLQLPEWYGRNLDALYDCLREVDIIGKKNVFFVVFKSNF